MRDSLRDVRAAFCTRPLTIAITAWILSAAVLATSNGRSVSALLAGFLAGFVLTCLLPGAALIDLLSEKLGPMDAIERAIASAGTGYVLLIMVALALNYLPIPFRRETVLLTFNLLILVLTGLRLQHRRGETAVSIPPKRARTHDVRVYALLLTAAVAFALRFPSLGYSEFNGDEAKVMLWAADVIQGRGDLIFLNRKGPAEILVSVVFYALLGRTNELVARLPFTIANFAAMLTIFQLGRSMFGLGVGLAAGLLASIEGFFVGLARVVQYQSLVIMLSCLSVFFFYRFYRGWVKGSPLLGAMTLAAGFLCHWDAVFVVPVVAYLSFEAVRHHTKAIWNNRSWLIASALVAAMLLASFFLPYFLGPHFGRALQYLSKKVRASRFPYFHLQTFFDYGTTYNSTYYSWFLSLVVFLEVAYATALSLRHRASSKPVLAATLILVPVALFAWIGVYHPTRVALLAGVSLVLIFVLFSHQQVETKAIFLWLLIPLIAYNFVVRLPALHIYSLSSAVSLLGGAALARSLDLLGSSGRRRVAVAGFALWYVVSANYARLMFVQTAPEYKRSYPDHRHPAYWTPHGDTLPRVDTSGFPYVAGWKAVGALYQGGTLKGDYDSNEKERTTRWYTRGAVRCKDEPHYYFLAEDVQVQDEQPVPLDIIADEYDLIGVISVGTTPKLRIYERTSTGQGEIDHYSLEDWVPVFDSNANWDDIATGVPRTDLAASIQHPADFRFGNHLRVLGYNLEGSQFQPGDHVALTVYWQMLEPVASGHRVFVHLGHGEDRWGQRDLRPGCGLLSDNDWISGEIVADRYSFQIAPNTPPGWYPLRMGMYQLEATLQDRRRVPMFDPHGGRIPQDHVFLTKLQVGEPDIGEKIQHPLGFELGDSVTLLGYDLAETETSPGGTLQLTLFWKARNRIPASYTVFTHLVDEEDRIRGQVDSVPDGGRNPTSEWVPGEIIVDRYEMPVSEDSELGQHVLRVGMYDIITGERLPVRDAAGSRLSGAYVPLARIYVRSD